MISNTRFQARTRAGIGRLIAAILCFGLGSESLAQRPDLSGTWERVDRPSPPGFERARPQAAPCSPDEAQLRLLRLYAEAPQRFSLEQSDSRIVITNAAGPSYTLHIDGRDRKLSLGSTDVGYRARWLKDDVLVIEWRPWFGGTIVERYRIGREQALLEIEQRVEHDVLARPAQQHISYRRLTESPQQLASRPGQSPAPPGQAADATFRPEIEHPAYPVGTGPVVLIDEAHANFHTATGRYMPFAELLRRDGYVVKSSIHRWTPEILRGAKVMATANAREPFTAAEVRAMQAWVTAGGSLLLITDHPPFVEPSLELGRAFGIRFGSKRALDLAVHSGRLVFRRSEGTLRDHPLTRGIDEVATFSGSSFQIDGNGQPLLVFGPRVCSDEPDLNLLPLEGHFQGAVLSFGSGRVAVFAEAAMFSAQVSGQDRSPMGMNAPIAKQNAQFLLNVMHWLTSHQRETARAPFRSP